MRIAVLDSDTNLPGLEAGPAVYVNCSPLGELQWRSYALVSAIAPPELHSNSAWRRLRRHDRLRDLGPRAWRAA
jgi:hypothetical protein